MISKILHTFGTRLMTAVINLLVVIMISQYLGPAGKGEQGIIITTIAFMLLLANFVGGASLVYLVPRKSFNVLILPAYTWSLLTALLFYFVIRAMNIVSAEFEMHVAILAFLNSLSSIHSTVLIGRERIKESNFVMVLQSVIILLVLAINFLILGKASLKAYMMSLYIAYFFSTFAGYQYLKDEFSRFRFSKLKEYAEVMKALLRYGSLNQLSHIFQLLSFRLAYYLLDYYIGEESVGIYSNAVSLVESVWLVSKSIAVVQYARIANSDDASYNRKITMLLTKAGLLMSLILIIIMVSLPSRFFVFLFGPEFGEVGNVILTLAPGVFFFNIALLIGHYFSGTGRYHLNTLASMSGFIVTLVLSLILIPRFDVSGAGIAASASYFVTSLVVIMMYLREPGSKASDLLIRGRDLKEAMAYMKEWIVPNNNNNNNR